MCKEFNQSIGSADIYAFLSIPDRGRTLLKSFWMMLHEIHWVLPYVLKLWLSNCLLRAMCIRQYEGVIECWCFSSNQVVCGQNPAYDYFSCQHQIFYKYVFMFVRCYYVICASTSASAAVRAFNALHVCRPLPEFTVVDWGVLMLFFW